MISQADAYGPEAKNNLELRLKEQRLEEERSAVIMLEEEAKEQRLETEVY